MSKILRSYFHLVLLSQVMVYFALRIGIGGTAIALEPCSVFVTHFSLLIPNTYHPSSHFTKIKSPSSISKSKDLHNQIKRGPSF